MGEPVVLKVDASNVEEDASDLGPANRVRNGDSARGPVGGRRRLDRTIGHCSPAGTVKVVELVGRHRSGDRRDSGADETRGGDSERNERATGGRGRIEEERR
jgi:hypothetical protein